MAWWSDAPVEKCVNGAWGIQIEREREREETRNVSAICVHLLLLSAFYVSDSG